MAIAQHAPAAAAQAAEIVIVGKSTPTAGNTELSATAFFEET
ncbi:hypothetical protein BN2475_380097 [Paraburkholderia ribeironis]|uniref:Uncharacterized protein n=1 Tax=Paraburkholderia ribeironis TaxID=1247936 RepID=A0A1N7S625_9BURK|nr:hypothetical protein BN2475_380097 [Paraburkholderia ribeironis]